MQIDNYIPITKAKIQLLDMIRSIDEQENTVAITKNGVPKAIMMSMEQYEAMYEAMEVMADREIMKQILTSVNEIKAKKLLTDLEDIV